MAGSGEERLKLLGTFGMIEESFWVISLRKKLFALITLVLILPLSAFLLVQSKVTQVVLLNTLTTDDGAPLDSDGNIPEVMAIEYNKYGWSVVLAIKLVYFSIAIIFSLLATSAVAYTTACIYASKEASFKRVMSAVLKVLKRLVVTFLWIFVVLIVYTLIFTGLLSLCFLFSRIIEFILIVILVIAYIVGIVYLTILSQLALVVSVFEDAYGRKALSKSNALLKGKLWSVVGFLVLFTICSGLVEFGFEILVMLSSLIELLALKVLVAVVLCFVFAWVTLVGLVAFAVIYFVCKSYHHEYLDMAIITDRLGVYHETDYAHFEQSQV